MLAAFALLFCLTGEASAEEWYKPFFVEGSALYYIAPSPVAEYLKPIAGFRAALGYEYRRFRFALESGFTRIEGTNPLVLDIQFAPLYVKAGYSWPLRNGFGLQADAGMGAAFSRTGHYETAIDMLMDKKLESATRSLMGGARFYGTYTFAGGLLKVYAGGGLDVIFETEGPIPLPLVEAGISFKPLRLIKPRTVREEEPRSEPLQEEAREPEETPLPEPRNETDALEFSHTEENVIVEETESGSVIRLMNAVYFEADSAVLLEQYRPVLEEAGERLRENPALQITLRAYAAPFGTREGQLAVSAARARFCEEYYLAEYGIAEERIWVEYYGAEKEPEWKDATWESYRCVEIIIE